jgi:hypothetical protein
MSSTAVAATGIEGIIDLARYPLDRLGSPEGAALIARCRAMLEGEGACLLPGFLGEAGIAKAIAEAGALAGRAYRRPAPSTGTAYIADPDSSFPPEHPRNRVMSSFVEVVPYDLIPGASVIRQLYEWDGLVEFLAAALGYPALFRYADPLGAINITFMRQGDHDGWHYDQTDFVASLLLQPSELGGHFEYAPNIRSATDENYDAVRAIFDGERSLVHRLDLRPGTLALFRGRNSLHRVSPVEGDRPRMIALFGFDTKPGTISSDRLRLGRYGRTTPYASPPDL